MPANTLNYEIDISQTASSGSWSFNTVKLRSCLLRLIVVKAASTDTTFSFKITDPKDNIIYETAFPATGTLREQVAIPMRDINTLTVSSASANEAFTGLLSVEE